MFSIFLFLESKKKKNKNIFCCHNYNSEPKTLIESWKLYFSSPLLSANGICMWRVYASIPLITILYFNYDNIIISYPISMIYVFLFATDALDGAVARAKQNISNIGKVLDPLADKILDLPILFLVVSTYNNAIFTSMVIAIIIFDTIGQSIRKKTPNPAASWIGKTKTVVKIITLYILSLNRYELDIEYIGFILLTLSTLFTFLSFFTKLSKIAILKWLAYARRGYKKAVQGFVLLF